MRANFAIREHASIFADRAGTPCCELLESDALAEQARLFARARGGEAG